MKTDIEKNLEIPEGIEIKLDGSELSVKSKDKELKRKFNLYNIEIKIEEKELKISSKKATKREAKMIGTIVAHITNMIKGLQEDFVYKLEICNVHFPMNVKAESDKIMIKNFLGEKVDRNSKILPNVKVEIKENEITVSSFDKEAAGQTAANMEKATKIKNKDRRIFQDGIFITEKCGEKI